MKYYKPRHKPELSLSDALLQGPAVGWTPGSGLSEPGTSHAPSGGGGDMGPPAWAGDGGFSYIPF